MPLTKVVAIPDPPKTDQNSENRRIWIGNLDTNVSEYQLLKILQKHGHMEKFDLMFHRSGPLAGRLRGYAFVTYSTLEEANKMKEAMDGKRIGSRNIAVRWAHSLSLEDREKARAELDIPALTGGKSDQKISRTTKIQAIEAKLKMMENNLSDEFQLNGVPSAQGCGTLDQQNPGRPKFTKPTIRNKPYKILNNHR